jgi:hypothetical protein
MGQVRLINSDVMGSNTILSGMDWYGLPGTNKDGRNLSALMMIKDDHSERPHRAKTMCLKDKIRMRVSALDCYKS